MAAAPAATVKAAAAAPAPTTVHAAPVKSTSTARHTATVKAAAATARHTAAVKAAAPTAHATAVEAAAVPDGAAVKAAAICDAPTEAGAIDGFTMKATGVIETTDISGTATETIRRPTVEVMAFPPTEAAAIPTSVAM